MSNLLLIVDFSVFCHNFDTSWKHNKLSNLDLLGLPENTWDLYNLTELQGLTLKHIRDKSIVSFWLETLIGGPSYIKLGNFSPILVTDSKPYWRNDYTESYKGDRPSKTETFNLVKETGLSLAKKLGVPVLSLPRYEADDLAAAVVRFAQLAKQSKSDCDLGKFDHTYLWTVDSDWIQMVSSEVTWLNSGPWEPLIRDIPGSLEWIKKRLKVSLDHPQDIVPIKCIHGDSSDNLPPGTKPFLIDLMNPHPDWNPLKSQSFCNHLYALKIEDISPHLKRLEAAKLFNKKVAQLSRIIEFNG